MNQPPGNLCSPSHSLPIGVFAVSLFIWVFLVVLIFPGFSHAEIEDVQEKWVDAEGTYVSTSDLTFSQARQKALDEARRSAIEEATGVIVNDSTIIENQMLKYELIRVMARGIVLEEEVKELKIEPMPDEGLYVVRIKIHAKVRTIPSEHRAGFEVAVGLNREVYVSGDQGVIKVTPSEDAYIYIFNVTENDHITRLVPNRVNPIVKVQGGQTFQFPSPLLKKQGTNLITSVPPGKIRTHEAIKVIATKRPVEALQKLTQGGLFQEYTPEETHMVKDLLRTLVLLDPLEWTEGLASYEVTVPAVFSGDSDERR